MDFFQELTKQAGKVFDNFASAMDELSTISQKSADNVGSLLVVRGKLENAKMELNKLYTEVGKAIVDSPDEDHSELIKKAEDTKTMITALENKITELKADLKENADNVKKSTIEYSEKAYQNIRSGLSNEEKIIDEDIDKKAQELKDEVHEKVAKAEADVAKDEDA